MLAVQPRRWLSRPRGLVMFAFALATCYWFLLHRTGDYSPRKWYDGPANTQSVATPGQTDDQIPMTDEVTLDPNLDTDAANPHPSVEEKMAAAEGAKQDALRAQFKQEQFMLSREPGSDAIYGQTMDTLNATRSRSLEFEAHLTPADESAYFTTHQPYVYHPYPQYNKPSWLEKHAKYVACDGPTGKLVDDIKVFKGTPEEFPQPSIGSYSLLGIDGDLCFERETRFGMYGFQNYNDTSRPAMKWDEVRWGRLQEQCVEKNKARFDLQGEPNPYVTSLYRRGEEEDLPRSTTNTNLRRSHLATAERRSPVSTSGTISTEPRTALLLRTYTGKEYNENDKQAIRALITELSLRTGGQYQIFLFVHVKDTAYAIWDDEGTYQYVLEKNVPAEFRDIAVLWNDEATMSMYTKLDPEKANVHMAQWLSVQKFVQEFPEFEYIWNWEMDARITGQHYDFLEKLTAFAKKQPRRGLWERNERYYIPDLHGDYDTDFRKEVEHRSGDETVWGPLDLPFITPVGPKPPVKHPEDDKYQWGVGEEADLITVAPIVNVNSSGWVGANDVWGYNDTKHATQALPRRVTIVTHSRISKRLLDIMHVENLRGNHIASEMACQTVAMLHGLKAVYAPMPIFFDRPWAGKDIGRWFNPGERGDSGGDNSAIGWGREARYGGTTWYYRATPPQRMYNNLMGYEDAGRGGVGWESRNGRPCLPPILFHPVKDVEPTEPGYMSESNLPFG
ncbi:hypothetical protein GGR56DRAFT_660011 [Xylariaceae sp. FL0804]|nr:hypothetical protein GGR56DRAFT_660011 [Xylariaceae sp. FL0804]